MELKEETFSWMMEALFDKIARRMDALEDGTAVLLSSQDLINKRMMKVVESIEGKEEKDKNKFSPAI